MCLSAATSRRPLFTTAYKIVELCYNSSNVETYIVPYMVEFIDVNGEWIRDYKNYKLGYSPARSIEYDGFYYKTGFHSYINLTDAIERCRGMNYKEERHHVFEVDTDDIVEYGLEQQKDIVVSRKIRFIQRII